MPTAAVPALHLRQQITDIYLAAKPPPGGHRATWFVAALKREPGREDFHAMARDFLAVVDLYRRLVSAADTAERAGDAQTGLVLHGLIGHATAELMGSTRYPGWRAAALDLLDPDGKTEPPIGREDAVRLFALALGVDRDADEPDAG